MKTWLKCLIGISLSLMCLFTCVGYAAVSGSLTISGSVEALPPEYDSMVITNVAVCSGTTASQSTKTLLPTNVNTTITGNAGDKVVYKITAKNESESNTYVYAGTRYDTALGGAADKVTITASLDEAGSNVVPSAQGMNYYSGTPIAPGEEITLYVTYTLNENISSGEMLINFDFKPVIYTITYMNGNEQYAVDCITDNTIEYYVRESGPDNGGLPFAYWLNANAEAVYYYSAGNTNSYTLSAKWDSIYQIMFVDNDGNIVYQESFKSSATKLSSEGQAIVDAKLAEYAQAAAAQDMSVKWDNYKIEGATGNITVRLIYTYTGNLNLIPIDSDGDGITDYYRVEAVDTLNNPTKIPGEVNGIPVEIIAKLYKNENNFDYGSGVQNITIGEGVKRIDGNALAYTSSLSTVSLPSTLEYLGKNTFSRNFGSDIKVVTINFNGTMAEWQEIVNNSHDEWHNGLKEDSRVVCTDGYFELERGIGSSYGSYKWNAHPN